MEINYQLEEQFLVANSVRLNSSKIRFTCLWKGDIIFIDIGQQFLGEGGLFEMASFPTSDFSELLEKIGVTYKDQFQNWYNSSE